MTHPLLSPLPLISLLLVLSCQGCVFDLFGRSAGFDQRPITVQTVSFFNQRVNSRLAKKSWKGDWIFRRDRLEMIDEELKNSKPDLLILQEVIAKVGSTAESDEQILAAGSLVDYEWRKRQVEEYADTQEVQYMAMAVGVPYKFIEKGDDDREVWIMGSGGYLMAATMDYEDQPIAVFDVQMPPQTDNSYLWYSFIQERILDRLKQKHLCPKRVIVGGYLPGDEGAVRFGTFMKTVGLKDASAGFCQIDSKCYTSTPTNDLFMATVGDESPTRTDRIFVHQSAYVYSSSRNFEDSDPSNRYARDFGLTRIWPTQRFGWIANLRLARCADGDFVN